METRKVERKVRQQRVREKLKVRRHRLREELRVKELGL